MPSETPLWPCQPLEHRSTHLGRDAAHGGAVEDPPRRHIAHPRLRVRLGDPHDVHAAERVREHVVLRARDGAAAAPSRLELAQAREEQLEVLSSGTCGTRPRRPARCPGASRARAGGRSGSGGTARRWRPTRRRRRPRARPYAVAQADSLGASGALTPAGAKKPAGASQRPFHTGGRFSANARGPPAGPRSA